MKIIECPRDAMQGMSDFVPTSLKVEYLNSLLKVGFDTLDFGSFVSPKAIPQMQDTEKVLAQLKLGDSKTKLLAIIVNLRGAEQAVKYPEISYLGYPFSISETFQKRNTNTSIAHSFELVKQLQGICEANNKTLVIYLSMAFGNPYKDKWSNQLALNWIAKLTRIGIKIVSLSDTTGIANPQSIDELITLSNNEFTSTEFGLHLHTNQQNWEAKVKAAYYAGCIRFDSAIGGYGGCPFATDELVGNLSTQKLLSFLDVNQKKEPVINKTHLEKSIKISQKIFNY